VLQSRYQAHPSGIGCHASAQHPLCQLSPCMVVTCMLAGSVALLSHKHDQTPSYISSAAFMPCMPRSTDTKPSHARLHFLCSSFAQTQPITQPVTQPQPFAQPQPQAPSRAPWYLLNHRRALERVWRPQQQLPTKRGKLPGCCMAGEFRACLLFLRLIRSLTRA
jgi:hypothetical protein